MVERARQDAFEAVQTRAHQRSNELRSQPAISYMQLRPQLKSSKRRNAVPVYTTAESLHQYAILAARTRAVRRLQRALAKTSLKACSNARAAVDENQHCSRPCIKCGCTCSLKKH
jgi:hypothetical protein